MVSDYLSILAPPAATPTLVATPLGNTTNSIAPVWVQDFNQSNTWEQLLGGDGWTYDSTDGHGVGYWVRPGKDRRLGHSATTNYENLDKLIVFTTSIPWLPPESYDRWAYMVFRVYGGDFKAASRDYMPKDRQHTDPATLLPGGKSLKKPGTTDKEQPPIHLPDEFWNARPALAHVRQAAWSRYVAPDVVLHALLVRVAGDLPHPIKLPATIGSHQPLNYLAVLVGGPSSGKSGAWGTAGDLYPVGTDTVVVPAGSGEGLVEILFDQVVEMDLDTEKMVKVRRQIKYRAIVYVDEGETLTALGARKGQTLTGTLRSIFSGQTLGQTNASESTKRIVPAGLYSYGIAVGLQPGLAGALLDDHAAGTPQRFGWAWATDPSMPDHTDWPGALPSRGDIAPQLNGWMGGLRIHVMAVDTEIIAVMVDRRLALVKGIHEIDTMDAHGDLLRLKIAGLLAVIDGRLNIDTEDWRLAGVVADTSRAVRQHVQGVVADQAKREEQATSKRLSRRQVEAVTAVEDSQVRRVAGRIVSLVEMAGGGGMSEGQITRALSRAQRAWFQEGLALALGAGDIEVRTEPGQGEDKHRYHQGVARG